MLSRPICSSRMSCCSAASRGTTVPPSSCMRSKAGSLELETRGMSLRSCTCRGYQARCATAFSTTRRKSFLFWFSVCFVVVLVLLFCLVLVSLCGFCVFLWRGNIKRLLSSGSFFVFLGCLCLCLLLLC